LEKFLKFSFEFLIPTIKLFIYFKRNMYEEVNWPMFVWTLHYVMVIQQEWIYYGLVHQWLQCHVYF